jgi:hypothetical protein
MKRRLQSDNNPARKKQRLAVPQIKSRGETLIEFAILRGMCSVATNLRLAEVNSHYRQLVRFQYTLPIRVQLTTEATALDVQRAIWLISAPTLILDCADAAYPVKCSLIHDSLQIVHQRQAMLQLARDMGFGSEETEVVQLPYYLEHVGVLKFCGNTAFELGRAYPKERQAAYATLW